MILDGRGTRIRSSVWPKSDYARNAKETKVGVYGSNYCVVMVCIHFMESELSVFCLEKFGILLSIM